VLGSAKWWISQILSGWLTPSLVGVVIEEKNKKKKYLKKQPLNHDEVERSSMVIVGMGQVISS